MAHATAKKVGMRYMATAFTSLNFLCYSGLRRQTSRDKNYESPRKQSVFLETCAAGYDVCRYRTMGGIILQCWFIICRLDLSQKVFYDLVVNPAPKRIINPRSFKRLTAASLT